MQAEAARVERGRRLVVHLVGGDLHHLVFEADRVAGRADLVAAVASGCETARALAVEPAMCVAFGARERDTPMTGRACCARNSAAPDRAGGNPGVSALATFSASTRWRSWCHCIRVRSIEKIGMSAIAMVCLRGPRACPARQTLPGVWLMRGKGIGVSKPPHSDRVYHASRFRLGKLRCQQPCFVKALLVFAAANIAGGVNLCADSDRSSDRQARNARSTTQMFETCLARSMPTGGAILHRLRRRAGADRRSPPGWCAASAPTASAARARGRQPRLAVIDAAAVDGRRRLVLIRRDNVEHLMMIGGPTDVVVEPNIVRAAAAATPRDARAATARAPRPLPRAIPLADARRHWPLQPTVEPPSGRAPSAPRRACAAIVHGRAVGAAEQPPPRPPASPPIARSAAPRRQPAPASAQRVRRQAEPEFDVRRPRRRRAAVARRAAAPCAGRRRRRRSAAPPQNDHNLAEMAQRLEAALRRPNADRHQPPVTDPLAAPHRERTRRRSRCRRRPSRSARRARRAAPEREAGGRRPREESLRQPRTGDGELARPPAREDLTARRFRPPRPSGDDRGRGSGRASQRRAGARAGHQHQFRPRHRAHRARDPADRAAHGAVAGAVDPDHDDVVHAHRGGAVAAAHRARHRDRAAQRGDRLARAVPHRLRDGAGAAARLRHRHPAADRQRDHRRAGVRARAPGRSSLHAEERAREGPQAVRRPVARAGAGDSRRTCRCASWCRPS